MCLVAMVTSVQITCNVHVNEEFLVNSLFYLQSKSVCLHVNSVADTVFTCKTGL